MLNLKDMTTTDLKEMAKAIQQELAARNKTTELALYTHECKDAGNGHLRKYKHWAKLIKSVDTTKTNGFAFIGDFLDTQQEHKVPVGSLIAEVCWETITIYKMTANGKEEVLSGKTTAMSSVIDKVAEML